MPVAELTYLDETSEIFWLENGFSLLLEEDISQVKPLRPGPKPGRNGRVRGALHQTIVSAQRPIQGRVLPSQPQTVTLNLIFDVVVDDEIMMMLA